MILVMLLLSSTILKTEEEILAFFNSLSSYEPCHTGMLIRWLYHIGVNNANVEKSVIGRVAKFLAELVNKDYFPNVFGHVLMQFRHVTGAEPKYELIIGICQAVRVVDKAAIDETHDFLKNGQRSKAAMSLNKLAHRSDKLKVVYRAARLCQNPLDAICVIINVIEHSRRHKFIREAGIMFIGRLDEINLHRQFGPSLIRV